MDAGNWNVEQIDFFLLHRIRKGRGGGRTHEEMRCVMTKMAGL